MAIMEIIRAAEWLTEFCFLWFRIISHALRHLFIVFHPFFTTCCMFIRAPWVYNQPFIRTYDQTVLLDDPLFRVYSPIYNSMVHYCRPSWVQTIRTNFFHCNRRNYRCLTHLFSKCLIFLAAKGFFLKLISTNLLSGSIVFFLFFLLFSKVLLYRNVTPALSTPPFVVYHVLYQLFFFILLQVNFTFYSIWKDREQGRSSHTHLQHSFKFTWL